MGIGEQIALGVNQHPRPQVAVALLIDRRVAEKMAEQGIPEQRVDSALLNLSGVHIHHRRGDGGHRRAVGRDGRGGCGPTRDAGPNGASRQQAWEQVQRHEGGRQPRRDGLGEELQQTRNVIHEQQGMI